MYYGEFGDTDCWRPAAEAAAILMSKWGAINAPREVRAMIQQAIETGYATALAHVRDGEFDGQIRMWRDVAPP